MRRLNILVVYNCSVFPLRATTWYHLYCFQRYSGANCFYLNVALRNLPRYLWRIPIDLIVFDTLFMCSRWDRQTPYCILDKVRALAQMPAVRVALPQDEFINTDILCDFINALAIDLVFSVAPPSEWPRIYDAVDQAKVRFHYVLPGYLDDEVVHMMQRRAARSKHRRFDIGYRTAGRPYAWFGRHGYLKQRIADVFQERAPKFGLKVDISTSSADTLLGNKWYEFLLDCKYTLGVEGGTSILDRDGTLHRRTADYLAAHPLASFEEVEAACFPTLDGSFRLFLISPRHLEACASHTCQLLTTGEYGGILQAGTHYVEVKKDFSNIDEVLQLVADDRLRSQITAQAYADIVASGKYSYRQFVAFILERALPSAWSPPAPSVRPERVRSGEARGSGSGDDEQHADGKRFSGSEREYWTDLHRRYPGALRAVGHPSLCEELNRLKYASEAQTLLSVLAILDPELRGTGSHQLSVLDAGAGTGYWSELIEEYFRLKGIGVAVTAVDISQDALDGIRARRPHVATLHEDLASCEVDRLAAAFDLVISCYCLHHLVRVEDFLHALRFLARSLRPGGFLVLMDPVLTLSYSRLDVIDFASFRGNGIPRHLYLIDDILSREGFKRRTLVPAVSFLLNGAIQGYGPVSYAILNRLWWLFNLVYRSEPLVRRLARWLVAVDRTLKERGLGFSSSVCVFGKSPLGRIEGGVDPQGTFPGR